MSEEFEIRGSAVDRAALDHLAEDHDVFSDRLRAFRIATELLDRWRGEFGGPVQRPQLQLTHGQQLTIHTREGDHKIPKTRVFAEREADGRFRFDLHVEQGDGSFLVMEALRIADVTEAIVPLSAVHLAPVVAPPAGEVALKGPTGTERVVWGDDGVRRTYVGDELLPNRVARFA